jgi:hypothetical protein
MLLGYFYQPVQTVIIVGILQYPQAICVSNTDVFNIRNRWNSDGLLAAAFLFTGRQNNNDNHQELE